MKFFNLYGGWPILMEKGDTNLKNFTWQEIDDTYNKLFGYSSFFKISYEPDVLNSTRNIITVSFFSRKAYVKLYDPHIFATIIIRIFNMKYVKEHPRIINSITSNI